VVVPLVARRRLRAVGAAGAAFLVIAVVTIPALGVWDVTPAIRSTQEASVVGLTTATSHNQSIPGVVLRATGSEAATRLAFAVVTVAAIVALVRVRWPDDAVLAVAVPVMLLSESSAGSTTSS
jgi:hypothetical protein